MQRMPLAVLLCNLKKTDGSQHYSLGELIKSKKFCFLIILILIHGGIYGFSDYTLTNIQDYPVYEKSKKTASKCKNGVDKEYGGLCHTKEIYKNELFYE